MALFPHIEIRVSFISATTKINRKESLTVNVTEMRSFCLLQYDQRNVVENKLKLLCLTNLI